MIRVSLGGLAELCLDTAYPSSSTFNGLARVPVRGLRVLAAGRSDSVAEPACLRRARPRAIVSGTAAVREIPAGATVSAKRTVQALLQWNRRRIRWLRSDRHDTRAGARKRNRGAAESRRAVVKVRSAPTTVPPLLWATSR